jgi:hypothetical protein
MLYLPAMRNFKHSPWLAFAILTLAGVACSGFTDIIGQRNTAPTPTAPVFSTATPGGRVSVWLVTPTGQGEQPAQATPTPFGQIVAPAATATAAYATLQAGTAIAGATLSGPVFQPTDCPEPASPLPPARPNNFSQFPEIIGLYLSAGGPATILEATLRTWGAVAEGAVVQADTDLTGDGVKEILVTLYDPALYKPGQLSPGELLVYGCAQKGYKLIYSTPYSPATIIPELRRVGDMNNDARAELAYSQQTCNAAQCTQAMMILSWNATLGVFKTLNEYPMNASSARIGIADLDKDGVLEVSINFNPSPDQQAGPPRRTTDIWDWDGVVYRLAITQVEAPVYRIHAAHDGDLRFRQANWRDAIRLYDRVRDDARLQPWTLPDEAMFLRAYATYKKMLAQLSLRQTRQADESLAGLLAENPAGTPGEGYAIIGQTFMDSYKRLRDRRRACADALSIAATRPETLGLLNSYGFNNPTYSLGDLCPFTEK